MNKREGASSISRGFTLVAIIISSSVNSCVHTIPDFELNEPLFLLSASSPPPALCIFTKEVLIKNLALLYGATTMLPTSSPNFIFQIPKLITYKNHSTKYNFCAFSKKPKHLLTIDDSRCRHSLRFVNTGDWQVLKPHNREILWRSITYFALPYYSTASAAS